VARVLRPAFRLGPAAARRGGWAALGLALLAYVPVGASVAFAGGALAPVGLVLHGIVVLALVRLLAARRPGELPPPPQVDELGRRVATPPRPGPPVTPADASLRRALRNAGAFWRPAISLAGLYLLCGFAALLVAVALSGGKYAEYTPTTQGVVIVPLFALVSAFAALAPQRVAIEGDTRVLVAVAHSVRIAWTAYGTLLLLSAAEPVVGAAGLLAISGKNPPVGRVVAVSVASVVVTTLLKVVTTAVATEVYLAGPRLDLPLDPAL
jgi:hypothetical protein